MRGKLPYHLVLQRRNYSRRNFNSYRAKKQIAEKYASPRVLKLEPALSLDRCLLAGSNLAGETYAS
jgi:hypothetical protein